MKSKFDELSARCGKETTLPQPCRKGGYLAYAYDRQLPNKIVRVPSERLMKERIRISNARKFLLTLDSLVRYKWNIL